MDATELMMQFIKEVKSIGSSVTHIQKAEIPEEDKATLIISIISAMLDDLSSEDVKYLFNIYPLVSGREDLK